MQNDKSQKLSFLQEHVPLSLNEFQVRINKHNLVMFHVYSTYDPCLYISVLKHN